MYRVFKGMGLRSAIIAASAVEVFQLEGGGGGALGGVESATLTVTGMLVGVELPKAGRGD